MKAIQGTILDNLPLNVSEVIKIAAVNNSCIQAHNDSRDLCSSTLLVQPAHIINSFIRVNKTKVICADLLNLDCD